MHKPHLRYKSQTRRERTWTIHLISAEKVLKATILIVVGYKLLALMGSDVHQWAANFIERHGINEANRYVQTALQRLVGIGDRQVLQLSLASFIYAAILYVEGIGLWLQKRWAEYLTAIATGLFIPFEAYELYQRFTWVRIAALAVNVFIVWYLATRLRDEKKEADQAAYVKICGITNLTDAKRALRAGADAVGFNFYLNSPRYILPQRAAIISAALRKRIAKVGVFVDSPVAEIKTIAELVDLDAVQLHGEESEMDVAELRGALPDKIQIIKAFRVRPDSPIEDLHTAADAILLDTFSDQEAGGTGETFDWSVAKAAVEDGKTVYLAGGLGPDNVASAIQAVRPYAVDACSRLEKRAGIKGRRMVYQFVRAAKEAI